MPKLIFTEEHEGLMLHYMMLTRQMAKLSDSLLHIIRLHTRVTGSNNKNLHNGYKAYAQTELSDVIQQTKKICEILGLSFEETVKMGEKRDEEKRREFMSKYPDDAWM